MQAPKIRSEFDIRQRLDRVCHDCFRQFHDFLGIVSAQGLVIELNGSAERLTGFKVGSLLSFEFSSAPWWLTEVDRRACKESQMTALTGKLTVEKLRLKSATGQIIPMEFVFQPFFDSSNMIIGILIHGRPAILDELPFGKIEAQNTI